MLTILLQKFRKYYCWSQLGKISDGPLDQYYFAYGANVDPSRFQKNKMRFECLGNARLKNFELDFSLPCQFHEMGFGSVRESQGGEVWGTVYKMDELSLKLLDILEWVKYGYYRRILAPVSIGGETVQANIYVATCPRADLIPSSEYLNVIIQNSKKAGHPENFIERLKAIKHKPKDQFELNIGFRITRFDKPRPFVKYLKPLYLKHDKLRQKLINLLP